MPIRTPFLLVTVLVTGCSAHLRTAIPSSPAVPEPRPQITPIEPVPLFFLGGVEIRATDLKLIDPALIGTIDHLIGPSAISRYGARATGGVIQIATKTAPGRTMPTPPLFLLDGREIAAELLRVLDPRKINSVEILKGPATLPYGSRAHAGVVLISSKAG